MGTPDRTDARDAIAQSLFNSKWRTLVYRGADHAMKELLLEAAEDALAALEAAGLQICRVHQWADYPPTYVPLAERSQ